MPSIKGVCNVEKISPEKEKGNIEYKVKVIDKTDERIEELATQMRFRTDEGFGESIYVIGVTDVGNLVGVNELEFKESYNNLCVAASKNDYTVTIISEKILDNKNKVYELLVREKNEKKYIDIKVAIAGNVDSGKCMSKNTKIRMYSGRLKNIQNIEKFDLLMGDDSFPRTVLNTTKGFGQLYRIILDNDEYLDVNKNHILCLQYNNETCISKIGHSYFVRYVHNENKIPMFKTSYFSFDTALNNTNYLNDVKMYTNEKEALSGATEFFQTLKQNLKYGDIIELDLNQYMCLSSEMQSVLKLYKVPIFYHTVPVIFDPYILGYWLGNGNTSTYITIPDLEIVNIFNNNLVMYDIKLNKHKDRDTYFFSYKNDTSSWQGNNKHLSTFKKIPDCYKYNSRDVRMKVIAGLIDACGNFYNNKYKFIFSENESICDDLIEIIRSLGFSSTKKQIKYSNSKYIAFYIKGHKLNEIPVMLSRNKCGFQDYENVLSFKIKDIQILPDQEYYGFELNGNKRYICDNFTVSHNSSFLGVLTTGKNDDGRGSARLSIFNFKHEVSSGRTSSIAHHILGFDDKGGVTNYGSLHQKGWPDIVKDSSKIISFFDLCGHEKYIKTTILGLTSSFPDLCFIMIGANMGITRMTQEHIFLCVTMGIPFSIVITKTDICNTRKNILEETIQSINKLLKMPGLRRIPYKVNTSDDIIICAKNIHSESIVPIFYVSNVTGNGVDNVKMFLNILGKNSKNINTCQHVEYHIDTTFTVPGVGTVVGGHLVSGSINVGDTLLLGPNNNKYEKVYVRSIQCKKVTMESVNYGSYVCLGLKKIERKNIKKGNVILSLQNDPLAIREFKAEITVLKSHSTTIRIGYEPIIHAYTMRQSAKIISISNKINARQNSIDDTVLRTGDKATATFRFIHHSEYLKPGSRILMAEGMVKVIGVVV
jgi:GTPase